MEKNLIKDNIELSIIIVNYNSGKLLEKSIKSIINQIEDIYYEIIIVDNNSSDNSLSFEMPHIPIYIYNLDKNIGFSKANNYGVERAIGSYLYFLNPDAFIIDKNTSLLLNDFKIENNLGITAPELLNIDNSIQYSARKFPTLLNLFFYTFGISKIIRLAYICDFKMEFYDHREKLYPDWVSGAAFIIPRQLFNKIQGFDENFFLYYEDVDLCKKIRALGYNIKYNPSVKVKHIWGGSASNVKVFSQKEHFKSTFLYFKKHTTKRYVVGIKLMTYINIILRFFIFGIMGRFDTSTVYLRTLGVLIKERFQICETNIRKIK